MIEISYNKSLPHFWGRGIRHVRGMRGSAGAQQPASSAQPPAPGSGNAQAQAVQGWRARLTVLVTALLLIEGLTGLWIYFAPFSVAGQTQVLLHTVAGVVFVLPYLYYQGRHFLVWYRQTVTATMVLGYALFASVFVCVVSGVPLTWQAALGPRISPTWDMVHLVSGLLALVLLVIHVFLAWHRRRKVVRLVPPLAAAQRRFAVGMVVWVGMAAAVVLATGVLVPRVPTEFPIPEGYTYPEYAQQFEEYRGKPFAPTYARTASLQLIDPEILAHSASCGTVGCHEEIYAEWAPSAHRFSAMNEPFLQVQRNFAEDREAAETRYCAGCHDPISLFAGAKDVHNMELSAPGMQEGLSCAVCHSISEVDQRGNADYVLTPPQKYLWEHAEGAPKFVSDFLIRAYPRQHLADYDRNLLRTPEFCGVCHKQFIPEALNRTGLTGGQNQYDEWRNSHWHTDDPQTDLSCRDCHMRLVRDSADPGRGEGSDARRSPDDGAHRHHGTIGANMFIPAVLKLPNWERHVRLTEEWLRGETVLPEIADVWPTGPVVAVQLQVPEMVAPGEELAVRVHITNRKAGHNFVTGPLDFIRAWIHLTVSDATGVVVGEWGGIDPETRRIMDAPGNVHRIANPRDEGTLVLEAMPVNVAGEPLEEHQLWEKAGGTGLRVIFPRHSDSHLYRIVIPPDTPGPLTVRAALNYRRYRQDFLDKVVPEMERESGVYQQTVTQGTDERLVLLRGQPPASSAGAPTGE